MNHEYRQPIQAEQLEVRQSGVKLHVFTAQPGVDIPSQVNHDQRGVRVLVDERLHDLDHR
jgi:hypothetical protein